MKTRKIGFVKERGWVEDAQRGREGKAGPLHRRMLAICKISGARQSVSHTVRK